MSAPSLVDLNAYALVALIAHWLALWLGIYLASRRPRSIAAVLIGAAFICGAIYLLKVAYYFIPTTLDGVVLREKWLGGWVAFTPALLLHAFILLSGAWTKLRVWILSAAYALAVLVFVWGFFDGVFNEFASVTLDADGYLMDLPPARFYWLMMLQMVLTLLLSLLVLLHARFVGPRPPTVVRRQLDVILIGDVLLTVAVGQILANGLTTAPVPDVVLFPMGVVGTAMMGVPLLRYSGRLGGQLLRSDARSSLLSAVIVLALVLGIGAAVGARVDTLASIGWVMLLPVALGGELRALADRLVYGRADRTARAGLRTAEAYAGTSKAVDLDAIKAADSGEVVGYLSDLDRAAVMWVGRGLVDVDWLRLLGRGEFTPVREALDLPVDWKPENGLLLPEIRERMAAKLLPRERQVLGLWYLGHSDKDMARLMGVKPNVPRSYLSEAKKKLGLPSGPSLTLFVHFAGFVSSDALPLL